MAPTVCKPTGNPFGPCANGRCTHGVCKMVHRRLNSGSPVASRPSRRPNPGSISRSVPESRDWFGCCVDLDHSAVNTRSNAAETRRWVQERGFRSLIVVTSNYHMPRAIVEMSHAMPDVELIPFAVIGDKWRDEPWWTSGATLRLLLSEFELAKQINLLTLLLSLEQAVVSTVLTQVFT